MFDRIQPDVEGVGEFAAPTRHAAIGTMKSGADGHSGIIAVHKRAGQQSENGWGDSPPALAQVCYAKTFAPLWAARNRTRGGSPP